MKCQSCHANDAEITRDEVPLCRGCGEKFALQREYELRLCNVADLLENRAFDEALEEIQATENALAPRDHDGWVHRSLLADRAMVLREARRWDEALRMFDARLALPFEDPGEQAGTGLGAALALVQLGRHEEARSRMPSVLDALERAHPMAVLPNLLQWADAGSPRVLEGRQRLIGVALKAYNLDPPLGLEADPTAVLAWAKAHWIH